MTNRSKAFRFRGWFALLLSAATLMALFSVCAAVVARGASAQPVDAGQQPTGGPIVYNLIPSEGGVVEQENLARAGAAIETRRDAGVAWAAMFVDGEMRPSALMGPTRYLRSISADIGDLGPGTHAVRVVAIDSEGRAGGHAWTFTVV